MKTRVIYVFLLLPIAIFAQEYSISGTVMDSKSNPIVYANVVALSKADSTIISGAVTNESGTYKIENIESGNYLVGSSFLGYKTEYQSVSLKENRIMNFTLIDENELLNEIEILAKRPTITRKPDRLIFNIENTALIEGSTLGVLKNTPGIFVSEGGINIKSAPAAVYINKRKVQLTSKELIQLLESAPAKSIKSVEVITNPPASYDADSGSVVNIIMSKNLITGYRGTVFSNYTQGVFPRYNAGTSHYFKNNKINLNINHSYSHNKINRDQDNRVNFLDSNNQVDEIWRSDINRNTWSQNHNLNLNIDYSIDEKNTLSLISTGLYTPYFKYQIRNDTNIFDDSFVFLSRFKADNLSRDNKYNVGTDLIFDHNFNDNAGLTLNTHYTTYSYQRDQNVFSLFYNQNNMLVNSSEFNTIANQNTEIFTGNIDFNLTIDEGSSFDTGVKFSKVKTDSDIARIDIISGQEIVNTDNTDAFKYDEKVFAVYVNYSKSWKNWDINLGFRAEQSDIEGESLTLTQNNTQNYFNWFPNASISHNISDDVSFYGSYKRSIARPSYTDLNPFTFFLNENTVVLGNPNLSPSYRDHFILGTNFLKYFTIEAYLMNLNDDIVELPRQNNETNIVAYTPINLDRKEEFGFDFVFDYSISNRWSVYAVTSFYNITEETSFSEELIRLDQWSNYSVLQNNLSLLEDSSLNIDLTLMWVGKNLQQFQTSENRLVSNFNISKSIFNKKGIISLSIEDAFNSQDFETSISYLNQSGSSFIDVDNRTVKLGFRYKFGNTKLSTNERKSDAEERRRLKDLQ